MCVVCVVFAVHLGHVGHVGCVGRGVVRFVLILVWGRRESVGLCWWLSIVVELVWCLSSGIAMAGVLVVVVLE